MGACVMQDDFRTKGQAMATENSETHPSLGSVGSAALGAAGEAAAFITGAPIAGAADSAIVLGESVAEREERLEDAVTGGHAPGVARSSRSRWIWLVIAFVIAIV